MHYSVAGFLSISVLALLSAVRYLLRTPTPLLDLRVLMIPTYRVTAAGGSVFRAVITATPFLMALFLQLGLGWSAAQAGTILIALFVGNVAVKPATTPLMRRFGIRTVMLIAVAASAICLLAMATLRALHPRLPDDRHPVHSVESFARSASRRTTASRSRTSHRGA